MTKSNLLANTKKYRRTPKGLLTNSYAKQQNRREVHYTLEQLHEKFLNDKRFLRVFKEWEKSGYNLQFQPTIDRIDCKKDYFLNNIQILTWAENRYKQRMELKVIRARKIEMMQGEKIIRTFKSVTDATIQTGLHQSGISSCVTGVQKTTGGYSFRYADS